MLVTTAILIRTYQPQKIRRRAGKLCIGSLSEAGCACAEFANPGISRPAVI
jgi:hypothetical protein